MIDASSEGQALNVYMGARACSQGSLSPHLSVLFGMDNAQVVPSVGSLGGEGTMEEPFRRTLPTA